MTHREIVRKPLSSIAEDPNEKKQSQLKIPSLNLVKMMSSGRDPKSPILAEVSEHKEKLRQAQNRDIPVATKFDPLGRMKEVEQSSALGDDLYYVETVDDEEDSQPEVDNNLAAVKEEMNRDFSWDWYRLSEELVVQTKNSQTEIQQLDSAKFKSWIV